MESSSELLLQSSYQIAPIYSFIYFISSHTFRKKEEEDTPPPAMEAICSFLVGGEKTLQLVSCSSFHFNKKKRERKRENYYANTLQFGFKYSLYYDEQFPLIQTQPTCQDFFFCLNIGKEKNHNFHELGGACYVPLMPTFSHPFFLSFFLWHYYSCYSLSCQKDVIQFF